MAAHPPVPPAAAQQPCGRWRRLWSGLQERLGRCRPSEQTLLVWFILALLPWTMLVGNRAFLDFDIDRNPYQHLHMMERMRAGKPLYEPISPAHSMVTYTPLYWWVCGLLWKIVGPSFVLPRLISLACALGFVAVTAAFVWRRTQQNLVLSAAAPVLVLATYSFMGPWTVDINVNAMHVMLAAVGFLLLDGPLGARKVAGAAVAFGLCVLAKQTGLAYVAAAAVFVGLHSWRLGLLFLGVAALVVGPVFLALNISSGGEFYRQIVLANRLPPWIPARLWTEVWSQELLGWFGLLLALSAIPLLQARRQELWRTMCRAEYVMLATGIAVLCISQPKIGSGSIHGLVAFAALAICGCVGAHRLREAIGGPWGVRFSSWLVGLQVGILIVPALNNFGPYLVDEFDHRKYADVAQVFRSGRACYYGFPYLQTVFGQPESGHPGDEFTTWRNKRIDFSLKPDRLVEPFRRQEFDYVLLDVHNHPDDPIVKGILQNYTVISKLAPHPRWRQGGNMRLEVLVMKANRLASASPAPLGTGALPPQLP